MKTLKEIVLSVSQDDFENYLQDNYRFEDEDLINKYKQVFKDLLIREPDPVKPRLKILVVNQYETLSSDNALYIRVFGFDEETRVNYSLSNVHKSEWLAMDVYDKSLEMFGALELLTQVIFDMCILGFTDEEIDSNMQEMEMISEKVRNGEMETVPAEEVFENLRNKINEEFPNTIEDYEEDLSDEKIEDYVKEAEETIEKNNKLIEEITGVPPLPLWGGNPLA